MKARISRTLPDPLQSLLHSPISLFPSVLSASSINCEDAPRSAEEMKEKDEEERKKEEEKKETKMVHEAEKRWERVGRSPDFLWGRMCVGGHETRMRRGTRTYTGGRACVRHRRAEDVRRFFQSPVDAAPGTVVVVNTAAIARRSAAGYHHRTIRPRTTLASRTTAHASVLVAPRDRRRGR